MEHRRSAVSDLLGRTPGPVQKVLDHMPQATAAIRREAFRALRRGEAPDATVLAERCAIPVSQIAPALDLLRSVGAVQVDDGGRIVAIGGLSTRPTRHRLVLAGTPFSTWCAIDALGIPAALEEDALVATSCQHCGHAIEIQMRKGRPVAESDSIVWFPTHSCAHVINEFCSQANLFCDKSHLEAWRAVSGSPPGKALRLPEVEALGREIWGELR